MLCGHGRAQDESKIAPMMSKILLSHLQIAGLCAGTSAQCPPCMELVERTLCHICPLHKRPCSRFPELVRFDFVGFRRLPPEVAASVGAIIQRTK